MSSSLCRSEWCYPRTELCVRWQSNRVRERDLLLGNSHKTPPLPPLTMSMMHAYMVFQLANWIREDFSVPSNHREVQGFRDDYSKEKWTSNVAAAAAACDLYALGIECMMGPALQWVMDLAWWTHESISLTSHGRLCTGASVYGNLSSIYNDNTEN